MWTTTHFPAAMRSLSPSTRAKAIEIANLLMEQGQLGKNEVIATSIYEARRWARRSPVEPDMVNVHSRQYARRERAL
ncbi:hypothetical protein DYU11_00165 [Fibrisoma montanum]|uniref:DUF2188 domain-containing protein n=1 Tax=Fibrisoma montanum TaxID=2305895 RepID=A0A418MH90_9BACT|nr:hypothetical protein [Fibrisoma montanum]RIV26774.1 hypothetical protein DYU11_00165 [Fibrisoma montanum]